MSRGLSRLRCRLLVVFLFFPLFPPLSSLCVSLFLPTLRLIHPFLSLPLSVNRGGESRSRDSKLHPSGVGLCKVVLKEKVQGARCETSPFLFNARLREGGERNLKGKGYNRNSFALEKW